MNYLELNRCLYPGCGGYYTGIMQMHAVLLMISLCLPFLLIGLTLELIGRYRVMEELGEKGWKAIIPFYGDIAFFKALNLNYVGIAYCAFIVLRLVCCGRIELLDNILKIASSVCVYIYYYELAKKYNHGIGFYLGLAFLGPIFWMILGSEHISVPVEIEGLTKEDLEGKCECGCDKECKCDENCDCKEECDCDENCICKKEAKVCQKCGAKVADDAKFCSQCGHDLSKKPRKKKIEKKED